jgi:tight adherence protein C
LLWTTVVIVGIIDVARQRRRGGPDITDGLPEVIDLFGTAIGAGLTVALAVEVVSPRLPPPFSAPFTVVRTAVHRGSRLADALDALPAALGDEIRPLVRALTAGERYGLAVGPALAAAGDAARAERRRRHERSARRLPVLMIFPLVLCILPALAVMTLVPQVLATLRGFGR